MNHSCENTSLQNVSVENLQFLIFILNIRVYFLFKNIIFNSSYNRIYVIVSYYKV